MQEILHNISLPFQKKEDEILYKIYLHLSHVSTSNIEMVSNIVFQILEIKQ